MSVYFRLSLAIGLRCKHPEFMSIGTRHAFLQAFGQLTVNTASPMQSTNDLRRAIEHQLSQCEENRIEIGDKIGHFISQRQIALIRQLLEDNRLDVSEEVLGGISLGKQRAHSPDISPSEQRLRAERRSVAKDIRDKESELESAPRHRRALLNEQLGALLSRRARIDKSLREYA